jgi:amino acid permease
VAFARVARVNAFHVCGALFAIWAMVVSFLGITRERFPSTDGAARTVGLISIVLCLAAIGTAIYTSATEEEESEEGGEEAALVRGI